MNLRPRPTFPAVPSRWHLWFFFQSLAALLIAVPVHAGGPASGTGKRDVLSVEKAMAVLETSMNKDERVTALGDLRNAGAKAEPARLILGTIIASNPCGNEAGYAAETLGKIGRPSVPVLASLAANGFEHAWLCARAVKHMPSSDGLEGDVVGALEPMLASPSGSARFSALLLLRDFHLSTDTANRLTRFQLDEKWGNKQAAALFIAPKANDPEILTALGKLPGKSMEFLTARLREDWRIRDCPIHRHQRMMHVWRPLPEEEQERDKKGAEEVARLARESIPEALSNLRSARGDEQQYLSMQFLAAIAQRTQLPREETRTALQEAQRTRGSRMDLLLDDWHRGLSAKQGF